MSLNPSKPRGESSSLGDQAANAPVLWIALAATLGVVFDRCQPVPTPFALAVAGASLVAWLITRKSLRQAVAFLLTTVAALGIAYHHSRLYDVAANDVSRFATAAGTPAHIRGRLAVPALRVPGSDDPLLTIPRLDASKLIVDVDEWIGAGAAAPARGRVVAYVVGSVSNVYVGDEIELHGRLAAPRGASNPGEFDSSHELRDQGVGAILSVPPTAEAVRLVAHRWPSSVGGWLGRLHAACKATLDEHLSAEPGLAAALLLGDGSGLSRPEWDKFLKSGVVHALAISGQHLVVLAAFLTFLRRSAFLRLAPSMIGIAAILLGYALLTGGRPPAMRAAWMIMIFSLGMIVRRPARPANTLALAWLGVILANPADIFQLGCQLSFLAVALIQWAVPPLLGRTGEADVFAPSLCEQNAVARLWLTPWDVLGRRSLCDILRETYLANAIIWLGITPLVAARFHVVSPIALLIGPPVVLATSLALASGFMLLLTAPMIGSLASPFAWMTMRRSTSVNGSSMGAWRCRAPRLRWRTCRLFG
jgi:competence protein ComEC